MPIQLATELVSAVLQASLDAPDGCRISISLSLNLLKLGQRRSLHSDNQGET